MPTYRNLHSHDVEGFGGKADCLATLSMHGVLVPKGYVFVESYKDYAKIKLIIKDLKFPLIVRSSSDAEDSLLDSMAGVFESIKVDNMAQLLDAINRVHNWRGSKERPKLLDSLLQSKIVITMNIIIQEYITSVNGGVAFVYPDRNILEINMDTSSEVVTDGKSNGVTTSYPLYGGMDTGSETIHKLQAVLQEVSKIFTEPSNIEWLITDEGDVYVLQVRPITIETKAHVKVSEEIKRLQASLEPHNLYDGSLLPDLHAPTPLTMTLLSKIYSSAGPFGQNTSWSNIPYLSKNKGFIVIIFGRPYLDLKSINQTILQGSLKRYRKKGMNIGLTVSIGSFLNSAIHPIKAIKQTRKSALNAYRMKAVLQNEVMPDPTKDASFKELVYYITEALSPTMLQVSDYMQFIRKQLVKRVKNQKDLEILLADYSIPAWKKQVRDTGLEAAWHLSEDENEIASPPLLNSAKGRKHILEMLDLKPSDTAVARKERYAVYQKVMSNWDKTIIKNQVTILGKLQQLRTDLHDKYVQAIRLMHTSVTNKSTLDNKNLLWFATIDEIIDSKIPETETLIERKRTHCLLQAQSIRIDKITQSWTDALYIDTNDTNDITCTVLSPGSFSGPASSRISNKDNNNTVLITKSLSQSIIYSHAKISGVITERGSELSHVAILARELSLPIIRVDSVKQFKNKYVHVDQLLDKATLKYK